MRMIYCVGDARKTQCLYHERLHNSLILKAIKYVRAGVLTTKLRAFKMDALVTLLA